MIVQFSNLDSAGKPTPKRIAHFDCWTVIYVQVQSAGTLLIGTSGQSLTTGQGGYGNGLEISSSDGIHKLQWVGDVYGIAKDATPVYADFEFPGMDL